MYLPNPANDETLTMSGYEWHSYKKEIEREIISKIHNKVGKEFKHKPWPNFSVPVGHQESVRNAYNYAISDILAILEDLDKP